jgi:hypothetical protein
MGTKALQSLAFAAAMTIGVTLAAAQDTRSTDAPVNVPKVSLSDAQKQTIFQGITGKQAKKNAEPPGFRAAVGAHVPEGIVLERFPKTLVELIPQIGDYEYAMVSNQVLVVEPKSKTVIEVINE